MGAPAGLIADLDLPQVLVLDPTTEAEAARELASQCAAAGIEAPFVITSQHGEVLVSALPAVTEAVVPPAGADQEWAAAVGAAAMQANADTIVAAGGGRCLDLAKLAAGRAGLNIVTAPTQLSHDGICSPVAVVPDAEGRTGSLGAIAPRFVFISMPTLASAPPASVSAGIGDLLANPLALRDWMLAVDRGLEAADHRAWDLSVESFETIQPYIDDERALEISDPGFQRRLADALILSGMSMIVAGTSRPASGGEHEISHAIDELFGGRSMHGAQVAFGCIVSAHLYEEDTGAFRIRLKKLGLPQHPDDLGLDRADMVRLLLHAPQTRPGRFTILEASEIDEAKAATIVDDIWSEG